MIRSISRVGLVIAAALVAVFFVARRSISSAATVSSIPAPEVGAAGGLAKGEQTAVFAGGCFWGIESVFEHLKGVLDAVSGYAGGNAGTAQYETVSSGSTGHAESVRVTFDPEKISYEQLLQVFFSVAHDPTQLNRQGPDVGPQYRSAIFYANDEQERVAKAYIDQLTRAKTFPRPIVTQVTKLQGFYPAEAYHQDYMAHHPNEPYIVFNDRPKVERLKKQFPDLYRDTDAAR
jgi:peptide-methionine (S)-S-oxide reductase